MGRKVKLTQEQCAEIKVANERAALAEMRAQAAVASGRLVVAEALASVGAPLSAELCLKCGAVGVGKPPVCTCRDGGAE
jgi:hypothetical protein